MRQSKTMIVLVTPSDSFSGVQVMKAILFVLLLFTSPYSLAADVFGDIHCRVSKWSGDEEKCYPVWNMAATPRAEYVIERFDTEERTWQPYDTLPSRPEGGTKKALPADYLYRVRGCRDYMQRDSCVASLVMWVPFIASIMDELPDHVRVTPGQKPLRGLVQKNLSMDLANFDYNVGRLAYIMNAINPDDVTPMTPPPVPHSDYKIVRGRMINGTRPNPIWVKDPSKITTEMFIHNELYIQWEKWIQRAGSD